MKPIKHKSSPVSRGRFVCIEKNFFTENSKEKSSRISTRAFFAAGLPRWRRRRDLNPRAGYPTYALSRGASSPLEYFCKLVTNYIFNYATIKPLNNCLPLEGA